MINIRLNFIVRAIVILVTCFTTLLTAWDFLSFLSNNAFTSKNVSAICSRNTEFRAQEAWNTIWNLALLSVFILQHSMLPSKQIAQYLLEIGLADLGRAIYILFTSVILKVTLTFWKPIPICIWSLQPCSVPMWFLFSLIHVFTWLSIYGGSIMLDCTELLGISQVYYNFIRVEDPMSKKSMSLKKLLAHQRHPSFIGLLTLLWIVPSMTLDRFLLAVVLTLYSYLVWPVTPEDYTYHKQQLRMKHHEIAYLQNKRLRS